MANKLLKKKAWKMFALYIKLRDANSDGKCYCCTCDAEIEFDSQECNAGHFVAGRTNDVLFDEKITHSQCARCNLFKSGNQGKYVFFMKQHYGHTDEQLKDMLFKKGKPVKYTDADMVDLIKQFYGLINSILSVKFNDNYSIINKVYDKVKTFGVTKLVQ